MKIKFVSSVCIAIAMFSLGSCSKVNDATPSIQVVTSSNDIRVANGRLVFASQQVFNTVTDKLASSSVNELNAWATGFNFSSLRNAYALELPDLEKLIIANKAPAYQLITKFGLPTFYTAILNPQGEYQVDNKIYWFHDLFIYETNSEDELRAVKKNPLCCKVKYSTASREMSSSTILEGRTVENSPIVGATTNLTSQPSGGYVNNKWFFYFNLYGDSGSKRRWVYSTQSFTREDPRTNNGATQNWHSYMDIQVKYQYYSFGNRDWYDTYSSFFCYYRIDKVDAQVYVNNYPGTTFTFHTPSGVYEDSHTISSNEPGFDIPTGPTAYISNSAINGTASASDVYWTYEIDGEILTRDPNDVYNSQYVAAGGPGGLSGPHLW